MNKINENIMANKYISNGIMTKIQLEELMRFASKYDIKLIGIEGWSAEKASDEVISLNKQATLGNLKKREKPYDIKYLLDAFERKYSETYNAIVNLEEDGVESCNTCMLMKRDECFGKKEICEFYKHSPSVSKELIDTWPEHGDAFKFRKIKKRK
ncbi:MAG: hypothetical protein J6Q27_04605 [Clostridia bacterium]|nr:hypothetical protein [Clostridia bacterium]